MGKSAKVRNRLPIKPNSSSSENLEERLSKIENIQSRNSSNVFKYAFFFLMGMGLTIVLHPEISTVLAGIRQTNGISNEKARSSEAELNIEQEYSLDEEEEDTDLVSDGPEYSTKPNQTTFHYSERQDDTVKPTKLEFEKVKKVEDELINEETITLKDSEIDGDTGIPVPVTFEKFDNIEDIDNGDTINKNTVNERDKARNAPLKFQKSDPLIDETDDEFIEESKSNDLPHPEKDKKLSSGTGKFIEKDDLQDEEKTVVKEVKFKRVPRGKDGKKVNQKGTKNSQAAAVNAPDTVKEQKLPKEILEFNATILKVVKPKKIFADGRRIPPVELLPQKPNNSSVKVWMFEEFLSEAECDGLIRVHNQHVQDQSKDDPILCFDSVSTLRRHLRNVGKKTLVTPRDFTPGTTCVNASFSQQLKDWFKGNWSYSTAFYRGESRFASIFEHRVKEATGLLPENGGKFQITSYPTGIGYKSHTDCIEDNEDKSDRVATVLVYLDTVSEGGETMFPELGIWVRPRKARALVWNNMDENGKCEPLSTHKANKVEKGRKIILQRWYYYKSFYSLGKRPPEPPLPQRNQGQPRVSCDEYDHGSCRWYDEWNFEHLVEYERQKYSLI